jgi:hypothetical protein
MPTSKKISSQKDTIWIDENGFMRIKPNDGFEFNESDVQRQFESYSKLGIGTTKKVKLLVDATFDFQMNKEARDIAAKKAKEYFIATAIVSNSFTTRLLINFLNSFYNFGLPIKMFSTEKEAIKWLKEKS